MKFNDRNLCIIIIVVVVIICQPYVATLARLQRWYCGTSLLDIGLAIDTTLRDTHHS